MTKAKTQAGTYSIAETADKIGVSYSTLRRWDNEGLLVPVERAPGQHRRYRIEDVDACVSRRKNEPLTVIHVGQPSRELSDTLPRIQQWCISQGWTPRLLYPINRWPKDNQDGRKRAIRQLLASEAVERVVLPTAACAAPYTQEDLDLLCRALSIECLLAPTVGSDA